MPRRRNGVVLWLRLCAVAALLLALASQLGTLLVVSDAPASADATFLTYSVNSFASPAVRRAAIEEAAARYRRGDSLHVLIGSFRSREEHDYGDPYESKDELTIGSLVKRGVSEEAIEVLPPATHEYEEALALREALSRHGWRRVVAYVIDLRTRRTMGTFKRAVASTGVELRVVALRDPDVRLDRWWESRRGIEAVSREYPRLIYYLLLGRL